MTKVLHGIVHGRTIELTEDPGVADGREVDVQLTVADVSSERGDGLRRSAGAMADDPYFDDIMEEVYQARKIERREWPEQE